MRTKECPPVQSLEFDPARLKNTEYAALGEIAYMDVASRAPLSVSVRKAATDYLEMRSLGGDKAAMFQITDRVRKKVATLIRASDHEVAYTKNVSEGLNIIANALGLSTGDEVIYCPEAEHPNNVYLWLQLQKTAGIKLTAIPSSGGCIDSNAFIDAISEQTRLVTASATTFSPGSRIDFKRIGQRCRQVDAFFLVDGAQAVGAIDIDVHRDFIDGLAFSTQKGLLGLYGLGFLYCRCDWAERMNPISIARFSVDVEGHEADFSSTYNLRKSALRFDLGNYNFLATAAIEPSLDLLLNIGISNIDTYVSGLSIELIKALSSKGLPVIGGKNEGICNIVTAGVLSASNNTTSGSRFEAVHKQLESAGIIISSRRGLLRFSFHIYNTREDIARVLEVINQKGL